MSNMDSFLKRATPQIAIYWGNPQNDGHGGYTYDDPIEIACRWEGITQIVSDKNGEEVTSRALVFVLQDVEEEGMLYLGSFDDFYTDSDSWFDEDSSGDYSIPHPKTIEGAYIIKRFQKTPDIKGRTFLRKAYLTPSLSFGGF
jgi:hypothetical protein